MTTRYSSRILFLFSFFFSLFALAASGKSESAISNPPVLALMLRRGENEYNSRELARGFEEACREEGWTALILDNGGDRNITLANLDRAVNDNVAGIAMMIPDQKMSTIVVNRVFDTHIPIVSIDHQLRDPQNRQLAPHFGLDLTAAAREGGERLARNILDQGGLDDPERSIAVLELTHDRVFEYTQLNKLLRLTLNERVPGFSNLPRYSISYEEADLVGAMLSVQEVLSRYPQYTHWIVCAPNGEGLDGAGLALSQLGYGDNYWGIGLGTAESKASRGITQIAYDHFELGYRAARALLLNVSEGKPISSLNYIDFQAVYE